MAKRLFFGALMLVLVLPPVGATAGTTKSKPQTPAPKKAVTVDPVTKDAFASLRQKLISDGYSSDQVNRIFAGRGPVLMYKLVARTLRIREGKLNYDQFLDQPAIDRSVRFMEKNRAALDRAERTYNVDKCVITAILLVETHFGSYTGNTPVLSVLSTFALMANKGERDKVWALLSPEDRARWGREDFDKKLLQRSEWAYGELCALLELNRTHGSRPDSFKGSVMGAVGWPQFLPSSLVKYGKDGDLDGRIDLYTPEDAIMSVAGYLQGHGWNEAKTPEAREQVIWYYNHSRPYVLTILGVAARLHELEG